MKKVYIVLTHTGTTLSKIIKSYTKDEFSHVSISLDEKLNEMYSFGRLHPYNPFWAGFVHEAINKGTFKRFSNTKARIYSLGVTEKQYESIKDNIEQIKNENYKFNILGLIAVGFRKKISMKKSFYCAEFIKYIIEKAEIRNNLPYIVKPEDFKKLNEIEELYNGLLKDYTYRKIVKKELLKNKISAYDIEMKEKINY